MNKRYFFTGLAIVLISAILAGFVLPWLMSAKSTLAVMAAVLLMVSILTGVVYYIVYVLNKEVK